MGRTSNDNFTSVSYNNRAYMSLLPYSEDAEVISQLPLYLSTGVSDDDASMSSQGFNLHGDISIPVQSSSSVPESLPPGSVSSSQPSLPGNEVPTPVGIVDAPILWDHYFHLISRDVVQSGTFEKLTTKHLQNLLDQSMMFYNRKHSESKLPCEYRVIDFCLLSHFVCLL
jgi:hypothetical protein